MEKDDAPPRGDAKMVALLGASPKPDRYAYRALQMLREYGHHVRPVNPAFAEILGEKVYRSLSDIPDQLDTITVYLRKERSDKIIEEILSAQPKRIILNPGAENDTLTKRAHAQGIEVVEGCTLVMLRSATF